MFSPFDRILPGFTDALLKKIFAPLALTPMLALVAAVWPPSPARALNASEQIKTYSQTAPAVVQDPAESLRRGLLARLEFEELSLQLVGVARFQDQTSSFIKHPGATEQMIYRKGDVIGGYQIVAIDDAVVTFERNGQQFFLTSGESSDGHHVVAENVGPRGNQDHAGHTHEGETAVADAGDAADAVANLAAEVLPEGPALDAQSEPLVQIKTAADLKSKTRRFETARLIEEIDQLERSGSKSSSGTRIASSGSQRFMTPARGRLTSGFGYRRHPFGGGRKFHRGIDIAAPYGTPVYAAADGVVTKVRRTPTLGRYITIEHSGGFETRYGHLSRQEVEPGQKIKKGEVIGRIGSTGMSTGNHLHFEVRKNMVALDPAPYVRGVK